MPPMPSIESTYLLILVFVPGFLLSSARAQIIPSFERSGPEYVFRLLTYSAFSHAVFLLVIDWWLKNFVPTMMVWGVAIFLLPIFLGLLLGLTGKRNLFGRTLRWIRVEAAHPVVSGWDYKFSQCGPCWVLVEMKNERRWAGWYGGDSFASSDHGMRDIYIQHIHQIDDEGGAWRPLESAVWLNGSEISAIEFRPNTLNAKQENNDVRPS
jgi:Family of unknown function (DUF6338)